MYHDECMNSAFGTAIALRSIHLFQSHGIGSLPTYPCLYIYSYVLTLGLYRVDMGSFLALW